MSKKYGQITDRLGSILRELREENHLTREQVADRTDIGLRHVAAIELGEKNPSVDSLYRLIRGMGVPSDRIFIQSCSRRIRIWTELHVCWYHAHPNRDNWLLLLLKCYLHKNIQKHKINSEDLLLIWDNRVYILNKLEWSQWGEMELSH